MVSDSPLINFSEYIGVIYINLATKINFELIKDETEYQLG